MGNQRRLERINRISDSRSLTSAASDHFRNKQTMLPITLNLLSLSCERQLEFFFQLCESSSHRKLHNSLRSGPDPVISFASLGIDLPPRLAAIRACSRSAMLPSTYVSMLEMLGVFDCMNSKRMTRKQTCTINRWSLAVLAHQR